MSSVHPSSKGLRELADFLDSCVEDGLKVPPIQLVYIPPSLWDDQPNDQVRAACKELCKRLGVSVKVPGGDSPWASVDVQAKFDGVPFTVSFNAGVVLKQVEEMQPVKVWKCGGVEVGK